ncbi:hypothetical protein EA187_10015 [Lujinxingia sediminis]|uniref:PilZ domain-containing protein n=1 Tax=Lujinxingia sediminis TaxID=2480984 RepID=A0ABY0CTD6_9DELT|nr:ClpXP protease specificity-enhancing factor SspB [Lujinxingia sediminis]RVU44862.1 hypothetical protein EA187_10015 [Lujinxingia sediminis]
MSERDDELTGKVRRLFPAQETSEEEGQGSEEVDAVQETHQAQPSTADEKVDEGGASPGEDEAEEVDNVVRLPFGRQDTRRSPTPDLPKAPDDPRSAAKLALFSRLIEEGMVMVTLDPRVDGVSVPSRFQGQPELRLNFSHNFHLTDFDYDGQGVRASLSFQGKRFFCDIPWAAIGMLYAHETGEGYVFEPVSGGPKG